MSARVHTNPSNRAKARDALEKKVVFKSVLDSPFRVPWPSVPTNLQNLALACTNSLLEGVGQYQSNKKRKIDVDGPTEDTDVVLPDADIAAHSEETPAPAVLSHLVIGINAVTKRLDAQIRSLRKTSPYLRGAEATLAKAVGLRRIAVIAMDIDTPGLAAFTSILDSVPTLTAPWLTSQAASASPAQQLIPTHVKHLRTTAPKDMKMAKLLRAEGKAAARARKKSKAKPMAATTITTAP
ncbi:Ribonucleases p mrp protein subunit pop3 kDa subunit [Mycena venus]|uniref:Ribonucleases p mrp protein subunit pop3 kDa subunit n=1 Tax=Mycena venus TaxID=2733690 RepID=A0A8H7CTP9_9AGAR|nr:Ribonucleases p mrp protein subunit pop3 kDa subunit [Mycena venus]